MQCHPLRILQADEIREATRILVDSLEGIDPSSVHFKNISLHDPPKALLLPHLDAEASGVPLHQRPYVPRCVDIIWSTNGGKQVTESVVSLDAKTIIAKSHPKPGQHGPNDRCVGLGMNSWSCNRTKSTPLDWKWWKPLKRSSRINACSMQSTNSSSLKTWSSH